MSIASLPSVGYDLLNFKEVNSTKGRIERTLDTKRELRTLARN